jgi:hypothetical protein
MPLKLGATTLNHVKYNGVELTKVTYNGTVVYEPFIYYGFSNDPNLYKYNINLSTLVATGNGNGFQFYDDVLNIKSDASFLYIFSETTNRIHKIQKTIPASQVAQTSVTFDMVSRESLLFIDGTNFYSMNSTNQRRLSRFLTSTMAVAQSGSSTFAAKITGIMVDATHVYASVEDGSRFYRIDKNNLSASIQTSGGSFSLTGAWTMDNNFIYGVRDNGGTFYRQPKSTFTSSTGTLSININSNIDEVDFSYMCAVDATHFYYVGKDNNNQGHLTRTNLSGGEVTNSTFVFPEIPNIIQLFGNKIYIGCDNRTIVIMDKSNINSGTTTQVANPTPNADIFGFLVE